MKERPVLFSAPMVRAIIDLKKTQTRRVMKPQPSHDQYHTWRGKVTRDAEHRMWCWKNLVLDNIWDFPENEARKDLASHCHYGVSGDRLYVKEATWIWCRKVQDGLTKTGRPKYRYMPHGSREVRYCADHPKKPERTSYAEPEMVWKYKTARFMPRWASRITLEITDVRVQRLNEISEADAQAEGAMEWWNILTREQQEGIYSGGHGPRGAFRDLWDSINSDRGYGWDKNPWVFVWAVSFKRMEAAVA